MQLSKEGAAKEQKQKITNQPKEKEFNFVAI